MLAMRAVNGQDRRLASSRAQKPGGRNIVPMRPICRQTLDANFSNSELQRHGLEVAGLLDNPNIRKFVDWVANKDPDFTAMLTKKQR